MPAQERMTINRLNNFSRRIIHWYSRMDQLEREREAHLLRQKLQHVKRTKSVGLLIGMLRDVEGRRPVFSAKLDRVMINLREISSASSTPRGGGVEQKLLAQPAIAATFLLSQYVGDKRVPWKYAQSTGRLSHNGQSVGKGYSGHGVGRNNPSMEQVRDVGPIPRGRYRIGRPHQSDKTGRHVMDLKPVGHHAHGRSSLQIHGDKSTGNASTGCIVLEYRIRKRISSSGADTIIVVR